MKKFVSVLLFTLFCLFKANSQTNETLEYCSDNPIVSIGQEDEEALSYQWSNGESTPVIDYDVLADGETVSVDITKPAPNLLPSGDFESGDFSSFTSDYGSNISNGYFYLSRSYSSSSDTILKTPAMSVTSGEEYSFSFDQAMVGSWSNGTYYVE